MDQKKGLNPLYIFIPLAVVLGIIFVSKYLSVFGKADYKPGTVTDLTYTNEYFEIKYSMDSKWEVVQQVSDAESVKKSLNNKEDIVELLAKSDKSAEQMNLVVFQTPYNYKESGTDISGTLSNFKDSYAQQLKDEGFNVTDIKDDSVQLAGKLCKGYVINISDSSTGTEYDYSIVQYFMFKGNYCMVLSAVSMSDGKARQILKGRITSLE